MPDSLPADPVRARSLTDVMSDAFASLEGAPGVLGLPATESVIVVLIDGMGALTLREHAGHARFLAGALAKNDTVRSVLPSTTASALTSLTTGVHPGEHGVVGYSVRIPGTQLVTNQLTGWEADGLAPELWQPAPTVFERATAEGRPAIVVNKTEYAQTGFTRAAFRGAEFVGADPLAERLRVAVELAGQRRGAIVYTYANELDAAGHRHGVASDRWLATLETIDAAVRDAASSVPAGVGMLVTSDHGMVDVPRHSHVLLTEGDVRLDGVETVAGEPRFLHLYVAEGERDRLVNTWRREESHRSWVLSKDELIATGALGDVVTPAAAERLGDVVVATRGRIAYFDDRATDKGPQRMVGLHGSWTPEERVVPLIRLGSYRR